MRSWEQIPCQGISALISRVTRPITALHLEKATWARKKTLTGNQSCPYLLDFGLPASRTVSEQMSVVSGTKAMVFHMVAQAKSSPFHLPNVASILLPMASVFYSFAETTSHSVVCISSSVQMLWFQLSFPFKIGHTFKIAGCSLHKLSPLPASFFS